MIDKNFINKSIKREKIIVLFKWLIFSTLIGLLILSITLYEKTKKSRLELITVLNDTNIATMTAVKNRNYKDVMSTFNYIIKEFSNSNDVGILKIVAGAYFGKALFYENEYRNNENNESMKFEAIKIYTILVKKFKESQEIFIKEYVVEALFNRVKLKDNNISFAEEEQEYIIDNFKNTNSPKIKNIIESSYIDLSWYKLLQGDCLKANQLLLHNKSIFVKKINLYEINLAHSYLCLNKKREAFQLYEKYKNKKFGGKQYETIIFDDLKKIQDLNKHGIVIDLNEVKVNLE